MAEPDIDRSLTEMQRDFYRLTVERTQAMLGGIFQLAPDAPVAQAIVSAAFNEVARCYVVAAIAAAHKDDTPANRAAAFRGAATTLAEAFETGRL